MKTITILAVAALVLAGCNDISGTFRGSCADAGGVYTTNDGELKPHTCTLPDGTVKIACVGGVKMCDVN